MVERGTRKELKEQRKREKAVAWMEKNRAAYEKLVEDHRLKVEAAAEAHLEPGEPVLASISVERAGQNKTNDLLGKAFNAPGNLVRARRAADAASAVGFPDAALMVIGATDRRLLVFDQPATSRVLGEGQKGYGKPGQYLGEIRYGRVVGLQISETESLGAATHAGAIALVFDDGTSHLVTCWRQGMTGRLDGGGPIADFATTVNTAIAHATGWG